MFAETVSTYEKMRRRFHKSAKETTKKDKVVGAATQCGLLSLSHSSCVEAREQKEKDFAVDCKDT